MGEQNEPGLSAALRAQVIEECAKNLDDSCAMMKAEAQKAGPGMSAGILLACAACLSQKADDLRSLTTSPQAIAEDASSEGVADYEAVLADHRRLVRELDVAMHGEENAAKQASLCDLISLAADMRAELSALRKADGAAHDDDPYRVQATDNGFLVDANPPSPAVPEGWRDISTAPKDGTYIDIWGVNPAGGRFTGVRWSDFMGDGFAWRDWRDVPIIDHADAVPTHWMPLPASPAPKQGGE